MGYLNYITGGRVRSSGQRLAVLSGALLLLLLLGVVSIVAAGNDGPITRTPAEAAVTISYGETAAGCICQPGEVDTFTFNASAGDRILIGASRTSGDMFQGLRLHDASGQEIASANGSVHSEIERTLLTPGVYTIQVLDDFDGTRSGEYRLFLQRLNAPAGATAIAYDQTTPGQITMAAEMDAFTFTATQGDRILIGMSKVSGDMFEGIRLYNPIGLEVARGSGSVHSEIEEMLFVQQAVYLPIVLGPVSANHVEHREGASTVTLIVEASGVYTILAHDSFNGTRTGEYKLFLQRLNGPAGATNIDTDQTLSGQITMPAEMDAFTFNAVAGDRILIGMSEVSGDMFEGMRLYNPDGQELATASGSVHSEIERLLLATGEYTILVHDSFNGTRTGEYKLFLQRLNGPVGATNITYDQTLSGQITMPAEMEAFTFSASAGDRILIGMSKVSGDMFEGIRLYDPDGHELATASGSVHSEIEHLLTTTGIYTILAHDSFNGTRTGEYKLFMQRLNGPAGATAIAYSQTLPGQITMPAEMEAYTFDATAGDRILVGMSKVSGDMFEGMRLYDPDGHELATASGSVHSEIEHLLTTTGTYVILAHDSFNGTRTGEYRLFLQRLNGPAVATAIAYGQVLPGQISMPAEMDAFTFDATAGDQVLITMSKVSGDMFEGMRLYDPDGHELATASGSVLSEIDRLAPATGQYTILTHDSFNGTRTGEYTLSLAKGP